MEYQTIIEERHGAVARIVTNRPRYKNAQSRLMIEELDHAFAVANADDEVRVIILAAAGDTFSSGHDIGTPEHKADMRQRPVRALALPVPRCHAAVAQPGQAHDRAGAGHVHLWRLDVRRRHGSHCRLG
jgi:enoyl-CoA hydratase/carnithine racemase